MAGALRVFSSGNSGWNRHPLRFPRYPLYGCEGEAMKPRKRRDPPDVRNQKYLMVRVTGGLGSYLSGRSRVFWISLSRPLPRERVLRCLLKVFGDRLEALSNPLTPTSLSYAMRTRELMRVRDVWNLCVQALGDVCLDG